MSVVFHIMIEFATFYFSLFFGKKIIYEVTVSEFIGFIVTQ